MGHGRREEPGDGDEEQPGVERVETGEQLARGRLEGGDRSHAAEQHGGVQEAVQPGESFEKVISRHSEQQGNADEAEATAA